MKSAYEAALEKLEQRGIDRPDSEALPEEKRQAIAEVRKRAQGRLAELEIMHAKRLAGLSEPAAIQQEDEGYLRERRRIEEDCEREVARLRG